MRRAWERPAALTTILFLLGAVRWSTAQEAPTAHSAHVAYDAEMAQEGHDCVDAVVLADRNDCLRSVETQTYKNFDAFFAGLRETLIVKSPNDSNALALDTAQRSWEKDRALTCDAVGDFYDVGTIKHPGSTEPSAHVRCLIQLTRSRMRDLMQLYDATL